MKQITILQKASMAVGLCYGLWLGGQTNEANRDTLSAFIILLNAIIIACSLENKKTEKEKGKK